MLAMAPPVTFQPDRLGDELVKLRTEAHLSQRALARLSTVSNTTIAALEQGNGAPPHPTMVAQLAQGLATSGLGVVDEDRADEAYLRLMRAAGYVPETYAPAEDALLRKWMEQRAGTRQKGELAEAILDALRDAPSAIDHRTILNVVKVLAGSIHHTDDR